MTCSVPKCDRPVQAKGLCSLHYARQRRTGSTEDPIVSLPLVARFWAKVDKSEVCWRWTASHMASGHGQFQVDGTPQLAHRVAWHLSNGPVPPGHHLAHTCDSLDCVRLDHLRLVSNQGETCSVAMCDSKPHANGLCPAHLYKWKRYGDPDADVDAVRFWAKVEKRPDGCWIWRGALNNGYGVTTRAGRKRMAHRAAYELEIGPIPAGLTLDHLCRLRCCVNPAHLEPVSLGRNAQRANEARTHCPNGHLYSPETTKVGPNGSRRCRICVRDARLAANEQSKTARLAQKQK